MVIINTLKIRLVSCEMKRCKNGEIHFKNQAELSAETKRRVDLLIKKETDKIQDKLMKTVMLLMLPISCTALYEAYGFAEVRQQKFIDYFIKHMSCINEGIVNLEQYKEFCKDQGYKYFDVVEVENER